MKKTLHILLAALFVLSFVTHAYSDETALFSTVAPDALIVFDLSGSMSWNPAGGTDIWGDSTCAGSFYSSSGAGHETNCSRLAIAQRTLFGVLDDNQDGTINTQD